MVSLLSTILYFYGNFVAKMEDEGEKEMRGVGHMRLPHTWHVPVLPGPGHTGDSTGLE